MEDEESEEQLGQEETEKRLQYFAEVFFGKDRLLSFNGCLVQNPYIYQNCNFKVVTS